jgi:16S rRNA (cytidine1402-2'-O)-methyltransferase
MVESGTGTLFVVSTPIGNMGDFSFRGVEVLSTASLVLAEDTRHARKLLNRYRISVEVAAYHEHNEARSTPAIVGRLLHGDTVALISDAGTPLLSDPGGRLVRAAADAGVPVNAVPGPSALLAALVVSGVDTGRFTFFGFLPRKGGERARALEWIAQCEHTVVIYEAAARLAETLGNLVDVCGAARLCAVSRELTKRFEQTHRGTLGDCVAYYTANPARGEVVVTVAGASAAEKPVEDWGALAASLAQSGLTTKDVVSVMVKQYGAPRNLAYKLARKS